MQLSKKLFENRRFLIPGFLVFIFTLSYYFAFILRFEFQIPPVDYSIFWNTLPLLILIRLVFAHYYGLSRGWMEYAGVMDLLEIFKYNTFSSLCFILLLFLFRMIPGYSRSVLLLDWTFNLFFVCLARFSRRILRELTNYLHSNKNTDNKTHVLIVGAGEAGIMIVREMISNSKLNYHPVGFIDDNEKKKGKTINGLSVLGTQNEIKRIIEDKAIDEVIIAIPSANSQQLKSLVNHCNLSKAKVKTTPSVSNLVNGVILLSQVREISIEDLLGRKPVHIDHKSILHEMKSKTVLITGAGGSIGSELARQVVQFGIDKLLLFERGESELYEVEMNLKKLGSKCELIPVVGDILDVRRLKEVMEKHHPEIVYHAAAYKHVPMMEHNPMEAIRNNLLGTLNVADISRETGVEKFIFVSSDKAVRPSSIMGATKRAAELALQTYHKCDTKFVSVRFGNVLGSRGSVVPLFKKQIAEGGPVTVTHPFIIRFFMSIPEASQLIIQAGALGVGRELFLLDMGEPVRILDLAENLIRFAGYESSEEIGIKFTGLRPGEKLYEELFYPWEIFSSTSHKKIMRLNAVSSDNAAIQLSIDEIKKYLASNDRGKTISALKNMVPSFKECYHNQFDFSEQDLKKDMEVNLKIHDQEVKGKISQVIKGESIEIAIPQSVEFCVENLTEKMETTFYKSSQNKVVRFYSSLLASRNGSVPSYVLLEYPQFLEERDNMRLSLD